MRRVMVVMGHGPWAEMGAKGAKVRGRKDETRASMVIISRNMDQGRRTVRHRGTVSRSWWHRGGISLPGRSVIVVVVVAVVVESSSDEMVGFCLGSRGASCEEGEVLA